MSERNNRFALCLDNTNHEVSLIVGKVYRVLPDPEAEKDNFLRIMDESGEDYLYHKSKFVFVELPKAAEKTIMALETAT